MNTSKDGASDGHTNTNQAGALGLATGSAALNAVFPVGRKMLLKDAPAIFWRKLGEDLNARVSELKKRS